MKNQLQKPLVSISCITYNHASFLKECLDGFINQITTFEYEILINDDASTDGTIEIIKEYQLKFPNLIFPNIQKENQFSKGVRAMMARFNFPRARGKYLALCEGDDYWTDPYKLQKQFDFLENNSEYNIVFHEAQILENGKLRVDNLTSKEKETLSFEDVLKTNYMHTPTIFMRNSIKKFPNWYHTAMPGDHPLQLLSLYPEKFAFKMKEVMSVYRVHSGGIWSQDKGKKFLLERALTKINIYNHFNLSNDEYLTNAFYMLADYVSINGYKKITYPKYSKLLYQTFPKTRFLKKKYFYIYHPVLTTYLQKIFSKH